MSHEPGFREPRVTGDLFRTTCQACGSRTWATDKTAPCEECEQPVGQYGPDHCVRCGVAVIGGTNFCHSCNGPNA